MRNTSLILFAAMLATAPLTGCIDSFKDDDEGLGAASADLAPFGIDITATDSGGLQALALGVDRVLVHDASGNASDWFVLAEEPGKAAPIRGGSAVTDTLGEGTLPVGTYDAVMAEVSTVTTQAGDDGGDGHDHGDEGGAHAHGSERAVELKFGAPVNFTLTGTTELRVELVLDMEASDLHADTPVLVVGEVRILEDGQLAETVNVTDAGDLLDQRPPVARINVFGPDGALVYQADFVAESGDFATSPSSAFGLNDTVTFVGSDSEVQVGGTEIVTYRWTFDDGNTADGPTVDHAFTDPGVFEVTLRIIDDRGVTDTHMVRVVVLPDGATDTFERFTFDDGSGFTATSSLINPLDGSSLGDGLWSWSLSDNGNAGGGWAVTFDSGTPVDDAAPAYPEPSNGMNVAVLTSPSVTLPDALFVGWSLDHVGDAGSLNFQFSADGGATWETLASPPSTGEWTTIGDDRGLTSNSGTDVMFRFAWSSSGPDVSVDRVIDNLTITGIAFDSLHNGHLLEGGGHDGHGHAH